MWKSAIECAAQTIYTTQLSRSKLTVEYFIVWMVQIQLHIVAPIDTRREMFWIIAAALLSVLVCWRQEKQEENRVTTKE